MRLLANAKVNWALSVLGRREDGYHELDMIMQSVSLCDTLTIRPADSLFLRARGALVPGDDNNLVLKAARVLRSLTGAQRWARSSNCASASRWEAAWAAEAPTRRPRCWG